MDDVIDKLVGSLIDFAPLVTDKLSRLLSAQVQSVVHGQVQLNDFPHSSHRSMKLVKIHVCDFEAEVQSRETFTRNPGNVVTAEPSPASESSHPPCPRYTVTSQGASEMEGDSGRKAREGGDISR